VYEQLTYSVTHRQNDGYVIVWGLDSTKNGFENTIQIPKRFLNLIWI